jgi:hypothetical protein
MTALRPSALFSFLFSMFCLSELARWAGRSHLGPAPTCDSRPISIFLNNGPNVSLVLRPSNLSPCQARQGKKKKTRIFLINGTLVVVITGSRKIFWKTGRFLREESLSAGVYARSDDGDHIMHLVKQRSTERQRYDACTRRACGTGRSVR